MEIKMNENLGICRRCGGRCCFQMGCHTHPDDIIKRFGPITKEVLITALKCGDYSADSWDGDIRYDKDLPIPEGDYKMECWFIRSRHIFEKAIARSYGGICANLTKHGCKFSWDDRPTGGRALVPNEGGECEDTEFGKADAVLAWLPYSDLIEEIVQSDEFEHEWTNSVTIYRKSLELKDAGKTILDMIPD